MSRIKLLLDVVNGMHSLADSLEIMANAGYHNRARTYGECRN